MAAGWRKFTGSSPYPEINRNRDHSSFCYGVKSDRKFRLPWVQGKRDLDLEKDIIQWIEQLIREIAPPETEIADWLRDGTVLCKALESIAPGSLIRKINTKKSQFSSSENITNFLESAKKMGFEDAHLFELCDLLDEKDIGKVFRTLALIRSEVKHQINVTFFAHGH